MRSQLAAQFMPFFWLIARILTFCDKKYRILTFRDKKYRILTFRDKTELYLTVLQQNNVEACLRCEASLSGSLSGSLWLSLAPCPAHSRSLWLSLDLSGLLSGSLWLSQALSGSLLLYEFACKAFVWLARSLLGSWRRYCATALIQS